MKRAAALLLVCLIFISLPGSLAAVAPTVIFTAINDAVQSLSANTMPVRVGGQVYVPYTTLSRLSPISVYYNVREQRVLVYNFDYTLNFDLANSITYDESGVVYSYNAVRRSGTIFVPISLVCQKFGFSYSHITVPPYGSVIRINTEAPILTDSEFVDRYLSRMEQVYDTYVESLAPEPSDPDTPEEPAEPSQQDEPEPVAVSLAFEGPLTAETESILDSLENAGEQAAFFISGDVSEWRSTLRRILGEGHTIGLYAPGEYASVDELLSALQAQNDALCEVLHTRARLVWMPGSRSLTQEQRDALIGAGYRLWEDNLDPRADERSAYSVRANVRTILQSMERNAVVRLLSNEASAEALPGILSDLSRTGHDIQVIREWHTPVNSAQEMR